MVLKAWYRCRYLNMIDPEFNSYSSHTRIQSFQFHYQKTYQAYTGTRPGYEKNQRMRAWVLRSVEVSKLVPWVFESKDIADWKKTLRDPPWGWQLRIPLSLSSLGMHTRTAHQTREQPLISPHLELHEAAVESLFMGLDIEFDRADLTMAMHTLQLYWRIVAKRSRQHPSWCSRYPREKHPRPR